jgi:translation initiation factor 2 gamma subunit (eIF-2gamma)
MNHAKDATITISYEDAVCVMTALDYALCKQDAVAGEELKLLLSLVDRMASTFGFDTERLDRLLQGKKVPVDKAAFPTRRMRARQQAWIKRVQDGRMTNFD